MKYYAAVCKNKEFTGVSVIRKTYKSIVKWCEAQFDKDESITIEIYNAETFELLKTVG